MITTATIRNALPSEKVTVEQIAAITQDVAGRKSFDWKFIDAMQAEFGLTVGQAKRVIEAVKEERAAQVCTPALTAAQRIDRHCRENRIGLRSRR